MSIDWVLNIFFIGFGMYVTVKSLRELRSGMKSEDWEQVEGEITESGMINDPLADTVLRFSIHQMMFRRMGTPIIRYRYHYKGNTYTGHAINSGGMNSTGLYTSRDEMLIRYPKGTTVQVYVSPVDPHISVLEPGWNTASLLWIIVGALMIGIGVFSIL